MATILLSAAHGSCRVDAAAASRRPAVPLAWWKAPASVLIRVRIGCGAKATWPSGFMHFTDMEFHLVTPVEELLRHADQFPTVY